MRPLLRSPPAKYRRGLNNRCALVQNSSWLTTNFHQPPPSVRGLQSSDNCGRVTLPVVQGNDIAPMSWKNSGRENRGTFSTNRFFQNRLPPPAATTTRTDDITDRPPSPTSRKGLRWMNTRSPQT